MGRNSHRLVFAALLSVLCLVVNNFWYRSTQKKSQLKSNLHAIATLSQTTDQVSRKPADRLIWEDIPVNEELFQGEAIRTSAKADAEIHFHDSDLIIDLEPNSVIVLEQSNGKTKLDFLEGQLFVKPTENANGGEIEVTSGESKIALNGAQVSFGKSAKGLDVNVVKGSAQVQSGGKTLTLEKGKSGILQSGQLTTQTQLKIVTPAINESIYIHPETRAGFVVTFEPLPGDYKYELWAGSSRAEMQRALDQKSVAKNQIAAPAHAGRWFWQVIAQPVDSKLPTVKSEVGHNVMVALAPPQILYPQAKQTLHLAMQEPIAEVQWINPGHLEDLHLDIYKLNKDSGKPDGTLASLDVPTETSLQQAFDRPGRYAMRVSGHLRKGGKMEVLTSPVNVFDVELTRGQSKSDLLAVPSLAWSDGLTEEDHQYVTPTPELGVAWTKSEGANHWRLRVASLSESLDDAKWVELNALKYSQTLAKDGDYQVLVEALEVKSAESKKILARTPIRIIHVRAKPLLASPKLPSENLAADGEGHARVQWSAVPEAKSYVLLVQDGEKVIQRVPASTTQGELTDLRPGTFKVRVLSVDAYGRQSLPGDEEAVVVPDQSTVRAPTLKKVQVK
jgi:hypothetical protein